MHGEKEKEAPQRSPEGRHGANARSNGSEAERQTKAHHEAQKARNSPENAEGQEDDQEENKEGHGQRCAAHLPTQATLQRSPLVLTNHTMHLELITAQTTAAGSSGTAATAATGDSLTVKNSKGRARILAAWTQLQADGFLQIVKPSGHDTTRGFRQVCDVNSIMNLFPAGLPMWVEPQELLSVTIAGSGTGGDVESACLQVLYDDLPGVTSRGISWDQLQRQGMFGKTTTVQATLTGAAAGYTGVELITAESDLLWANQDYAVTGITCSVPCASVYITGPDTGYQKCAVPGGVSEADYGRDWFCALARAFGEKVIPVINSGNKASTSFGFVQNENNVSPVISVTMVPLK